MGVCSVAFAGSLQRGLGHVPAGDPVVVIGGNGDVADPVIDAEHDLLSGQEASVFEHGIGDLHPRKGEAFAVLLPVVCSRCFLKRSGNARDAFVACATWSKIGISHDQSSKGAGCGRRGKSVSSTHAPRFVNTPVPGSGYSHRRASYLRIKPSSSSRTTCFSSFENWLTASNCKVRSVSGMVKPLRDAM